MSQMRKLRRSMARSGAPTPVVAQGVVDQLDSSRVGAINAYTCDDCGGYTVTRDVDAGVTPMFLACRAGIVPGCLGRAVSMMYPQGPTPEWLPAVAWEWYAPLADDPQLSSPEVVDHCRRGGLLLRPA